MMKAPTRRRRSGFTYIESGVVLVVILLIAGLISPNVFVMQSSREIRMFKVDLKTLARAARTRAIESGDTVALSYDKGTKAIQVMEEIRNGAPSTIKSITLPAGVETARFSADQYESPSDGWRVPFYPDGASPGGGIEFTYNGQPFSFFIGRGEQTATVADGQLPDLGSDRWPAGGYQKRGG